MSFSQLLRISSSVTLFFICSFNSEFPELAEFFYSAFGLKEEHINNDKLKSVLKELYVEALNLEQA
jgi:hypothetical protein